MKIPEVKPTPWNLLYLGAVISLLICVVTVYQISVSRDTSSEWVAWIFVVAGFFSFAGGYVLEYRYKKDHPEEYPEEQF